MTIVHILLSNVTRGYKLIVMKNDNISQIVVGVKEKLGRSSYPCK